MNFVCAAARDLPVHLYDALAAYRHQVFLGRLGWELPSEDGCERDQFDLPETVHVIACGDDGAINGCGRLLPTTSSYLLSEVFPQLLNGLDAPCSADTWELSRFAAMDTEGSGGGGRARREHRAERLLLQALRYCAARGVARLLAVSTLPVERLTQRAGVDVHRVGAPALIGGQPVLAFVIAVNDRSLQALSVFELAETSREVVVHEKSLTVTSMRQTDERQPRVDVATLTGMYERAAGLGAGYERRVAV